jgi:hypothetical protein
MPRVFCTPVALVGVLAPGIARAQLIAPVDGAPARRAVVGATQPAPVTRQWRGEWFRDRDYFDPLIAEPRAPQIGFTFPAWTPEFQDLYHHESTCLGDEFVINGQCAHPDVGRKRRQPHAERKRGGQR